MATDYGVRSGLRSAGYTDNDIGYDPNSGYVTVKGQNFLKPEMNVNGTTYTSQDNFNNALKQYKTTERNNQLNSATNQYVQNATVQKANPYLDQYTQMVANVQNMMNQPAQDVYSTAQYAAAKAASDKNMAQANRQTQEAYGESGFGRSTNMGERIQRNANDANAYLQTQLVPQIQSQLASQKQQDVANQMSMLSTIYNLVNRQDTQDQNSNANLLNVINLLNGQNQQDFSNEQALKQANLNAAATVGNQLGRVLNPKDDWSLLYNQTDAPLNIDARNAQTQQDQWDKSFNADQSYKNAQLALSAEDNARQNRYTDAQISNMYSDNTRQSRLTDAQIANLKSKSATSSTNNFTIDDYKELINKQFFNQKDSDKNPIPVDKESMRKYIIMLNLDDNETDQLLKAYGLPTN